MGKLWRAFKAKHWDTHWVEGSGGESFWMLGHMHAPPARRFARWLRRRVTEPRPIEWMGLLVAIAGLIRCS